MTSEEKTKIVNKICSCGYYWDVDIQDVFKSPLGDPVFISTGLTPANNTYIDYIYTISYKKAIKMGMATEEAILDLEKRKKKFPIDWSKQVEAKREKISDLTLDYINHMGDEKNKGTIKKKIKDLTEGIHQLYVDKVVAVNGMSAEYYASECENRCKYTMMIKDIDEDIVIDKRFSYYLEAKIQRERVLSEQYREIARTNPWRLYWSAGNKDARTIFGRFINELSSEQVELCYWSRFYDSVYDAHERPSEEIIEDDLALDSWYANRVKNEKRDSLSTSLVKKKTENCKEIFVKTTKEGADKIYAANDPIVRQELRRRDKFIEQEGRVTEAEVIAKQGRTTAGLFVAQNKGK